nr:DUF2777 family protein [Bacillus pumilus]
MEKRMKRLERRSRRWCGGYLLIENGYCLIEDEEGDIIFARKSSKHDDLFEGKWQVDQRGTARVHDTS